MTSVTLTEFRSHASGMLSRVENGETLLVLRHGRPIAEVTPIGSRKRGSPSWKKPGLRLATRGAGLAATILAERDRETVS